MTPLTSVLLASIVYFQTGNILSVTALIPLFLTINGRKTVLAFINKHLPSIIYEAVGQIRFS